MSMKVYTSSYKVFATLIQCDFEFNFQVEGMLFFTLNYGRNVGLPEFDAAQQHCTQMVVMFFLYWSTR